MENKKPNEYLNLDTNFMIIRAVIDSTGKIDDDRTILDFFENIDLKYPSKIVIEKYTIEGEPTFIIIEYNGKRIKYTNDSTKTISKDIKTYKGNNYKVENDKDRITYNLYKGDKFITKMISYRK